MGPEAVSAATAESTEMVAEKAGTSAVPAEAVPSPDAIKSSFGTSLRAIAEGILKDGEDFLTYEPNALGSEANGKASLWEKLTTEAEVAILRVFTLSTLLIGGTSVGLGIASLAELLIGHPATASGYATLATIGGFTTAVFWREHKKQITEMKEADKDPVGVASPETDASAVKA